jgi:hypothetical protein
MGNNEEMRGKKLACAREMCLRITSEQVTTFTSHKTLHCEEG